MCSTMDSASHHPFIEIEIPLTGKQWPLFHNGVAAALTAQCDKVDILLFCRQRFRAALTSIKYIYIIVVKGKTT